MKAGRETSAPAMRYKEIVDTKNQLFDVYPQELKRRQHCEEDWGLKMSPADKIYYEDQKIERNQLCDRAVDPVWYTHSHDEEAEVEGDGVGVKERDDTENGIQIHQGY